MIDWETVADSLVTRVNDLVDTLSAKMNTLHSLYLTREDKENKKQHLNSIDGDHYPSIPAVNEGLSQLLISANGYTDDEIDAINVILNNKVDKVTGKGLSTNDFTDALKTKLQELESSKFLGSYPTLADLELEYPTGAGQTWHADKGGWYADVGVEGEDDIRYTWDVNDLDWVASGIAGLTPEQVLALLLDNADVNILTDAEQLKLGGIEDGAQVNVLPDWNAGSGDVARILNKPTKLGDFDADGFAKEAWVSDTFFGKIGSDVPDLDVMDRFMSMKAVNSVAQDAGFDGSGSGFTLGYNNSNKTQIWLNNSGTLQYRRMISGVWQDVVTAWDSANLENPASISDIQDAIINGATYTAGSGLELNAFEFKLTQAVLDDIALGKEAHGWGNHADEGYATEEFVGDAFDDMHIGGANILSNSNFTRNGKSPNRFIISSYVEFVEFDEIGAKYRVISDSGTNRVQLRHTLSHRRTYTYSVIATLPLVNTNTASDNVINVVSGKVNLGNGLYLNWVTFEPETLGEASTIRHYFSPNLQVDDEFHLVSASLQVGNRYTDWNPAPKDLVTDFLQEDEEALDYLKNRELIALKTDLNDYQNTLTATGDIEIVEDEIDLKQGVKDDIASGVTAEGWGDHKGKYVGIGSDRAGFRNVLFSGDLLETEVGSYTTAVSEQATNVPIGIGIPKSLFSFGARNDSSGNNTNSSILVGTSGMAFKTKSINVWRKVWDTENLPNPATETYVDNAINAIPDTDLSEYYTKLEVDTNFAPAQGYPDWALQLTDLLNF